jgi:tetratricopeptide (TPR) repeat protein
VTSDRPEPVQTIKGMSRIKRNRNRKTLSTPVKRPAGDAYAYLIEQAAQHQRAGQPAAAVDCYRQILQQNPNHGGAHHGLAFQLQDAQPGIAVGHWEQALVILRSTPSMIFSYANCLRSLQRPDDALAQFERGFELMLSNSQAPPAAELGGVYFNLACVHEDLGHGDERAEALVGAIKQNPTLAQAHLALGFVRGQEGRKEESRASYRQAIELQPANAMAWRGLAESQKYTESDPDVVAMQRLFTSGTLDSTGQIHLAFGLGKVFEDLQRYPQAFEYWREGNRLMTELQPYSPNKDVEKQTVLMDSFTRKLIRNQAVGSPSVITPVFIVSMPRAGSSLVEQILASHSAVYGAGELKTLWDVCVAAVGRFPDDLAALQRADWRRIGDAYLAKVTCDLDGETFVTDKLPVNYAMIGAIRMMFPHAKIVHCRREPLAIALSCYKNHFGAGEAAFTYDLSDLGTIYRLYEKTMMHWHKLLPGWIHDVSYESLTSDTELEIRRLLDFVGLPFEPACLSAHETRRVTRTASATQVRSEIHRDSVEKWHHFEAELQPFAKARKGPWFGWK